MADLAKGKKRIQITLSEKLLGRLDEYCERTGISRSAYISYVVGSSIDTSDALRAATASELAKQAIGI